MKLDVLVSTMYLDKKTIKKMNIKSNTIVINQCEERKEEKIIIDDFEHNILSYKERGLSKSRNRAIKASNADICLIADDDMIYEKNLQEIILGEFERDKTADIIVFIVERDDKSKKYPFKEGKISYLKSMKCSSVEIAFRRKKIVENNLEFNELLGAGAIFTMGEENEFLFKCLKKGLKIKFVPKKIGTLKTGDSTWFTGYNEKYFIGRGASFTAMSRYFSFILILQFAIRKRKLYEEEQNLREALTFMLKVRKKYLEEKRV